MQMSPENGSTLGANQQVGGPDRGNVPLPASTSAQLRVEPPATSDRFVEHCSQRSIRAMRVDVLTEIVIARSVSEVAAFAANPDNAPKWYVNIQSAEWLAYTYEFAELVPNERLVMRTAEGPFPMETSYTWTPIAETSTRMTIRNRGNPVGFSRLVAPLMAIAMRRANRADLERLKAMLETQP
jgi:hypothetical protein